MKKGLSASPNDLPQLRALVLDKRAVMGTEICRSLGARGWLVDVLAAAASPAFYSRFCARRFPSPPCEEAELFRTLLAEVLGNTQYDAIFVCNEEVLELLMTMPDWQRWPGLVAPDEATLRIALSKVAMMEVAKSAGVAIPNTIMPSSEDELPAAAAELGFPLIVKGDRGEAGNHVRLVHGPTQLIKAYREIAWLERSAVTRLLLQKYVSGVAYSVGGLFHKGRPLRACAHRKVVAVPPLGGLTVSGVTERSSGLLEEAFKIFDALKYSGLGHVELIRDSENRFRFLEINPRVWGTMAIGEQAGVDFFAPYLQLARGAIPEADLRFREGTRFHRIAREGKMILRKPSRLLGFFRDCIDPKVRSDFTWRDPAPHFTTLMTRVFGLSSLGRKGSRCPEHSEIRRRPSVGISPKQL